MEDRNEEGQRRQRGRRAAREIFDRGLHPPRALGGAQTLQGVFSNGISHGQARLPAGNHLLSWQGDLRRVDHGDQQHRTGESCLRVYVFACLYVCVFAVLSGFSNNPAPPLTRLSRRFVAKSRNNVRWQIEHRRERLEEFMYELLVEVPDPFSCDVLLDFLDCGRDGYHSGGGSGGGSSGVGGVSGGGGGGRGRGGGGNGRGTGVGFRNGDRQQRGAPVAESSEIDTGHSGRSRMPAKKDSSFEVL